MPAPVALAPRYEFTLFQPKSVDPTETAVLTQLEDVGQSFVVTTDPADDHPYLDTPTWRGGQIQVPTRRVEVGTSSVRILDARVTGQLDRWVTRFVGDAQGRNRLKGLKARLREWDSAAAQWVTAFTRRVTSSRMSGSKLWLELGLKDLVEDLDTDVFTGPPHRSLTYVTRGSLLPAGLVDSWAGLPTIAPLKGTILAAGQIKVDRTAVDEGRDVLIKALSDRLWDPAQSANQGFFASTEYIPTARVRVKIIESAAAPGRVGEEGDFWLAKTMALPGTWVSTMSTAVAFQVDDRQRHRVIGVGYIEVRPEDPNYLAAPAVGDVVEFHVFGYGEATESDQILIGPVHPAEFAEDLLAGKFGPLVQDPLDGTVGDPLITFGADAAAFATLKADASLGEMHLVATGARKLRDLIEKTVNLPNGLAYRIDELARYVPIDWRLTAAQVAGVLSIGDDDVVAGQTDALDWDDSNEGTITKLTLKYYTDVLLEPWTRNLPEGIPDVPAAPFDTSQHTRYVIFGRYGQLGEDGIEINAEGVRDVVGGSPAIEGVPESSERVRSQVARIPDAFRSAFGNGPRFLTLRCRRTANVMSCVEGSLRKITYAPVIDPATNRRGGPRLARCIQRTKDKLHIVLKFLDLGSDTVAVAPALGAVIKHAADGRHGVDVPVTLNALGEPAVVEYAVTSTAVGVRPGEADGAWRKADRLTVSDTLVVHPVPAGKRIWIRGRSEVDESQDPKVPSGWVFPAASYVDTDLLPAPSAVVLTAVGRTIVATCTVGDPDLAIMPVIAVDPGPAIDALRSSLPPGSARYVFTGLVAATSYVAGFKHVDGRGGESAMATGVVVTGATPQLPAPRRLQIRQGRSTLSNELDVPGEGSIGYGLWLSFHHGEPVARHRIQVSADIAFAVVEAEVTVDPGVALYPIFVQRDAADAERFLRVRAERPGFTASSWSEIVSGRAAELLASPGPDVFPSGNVELRALPGGELQLHIGDGGDADTERAYFAVVKNPDPEAYPDVDAETVTFVDRVDMPFDGPVDDGLGGNLAGVVGDVFLCRVRFWNNTLGFGQQVFIRLIISADALAFKSAWLETRVVSYALWGGGAFSIILVDLHYQAGSALGKSILIQTDILGGGGALTQRVNITTAEGVIEGVNGFGGSETDYVGTVVLYDDVGADLGAGKAGPPMAVTTQSSLFAIRALGSGGEVLGTDFEVEAGLDIVAGTAVGQVKLRLARIISEADPSGGPYPPGTEWIKVEPAAP